VAAQHALALVQKATYFHSNWHTFCTALDPLPVSPIFDPLSPFLNLGCHSDNTIEVKTHLRFSRADGSTRRKVEEAIRRGWRPGCPVSEFLKRRKRQDGER